MTERKGVTMVNEVLEEYFEIERERLLPEMNIFEDLELDSLDIVDLVVAMQKKFKTSTIGDIFRGTLRSFGQGTKVCCEIAMMAADSGLVGTDEELIAVAGTGRGADTALLMKPVTSPDFFDFKIKEILCKPYF